MGRARQRKRAQREQWEQLRGKEPGMAPGTIIVDEISDMDPKVWNDLMTPGRLPRGPAQPAPWTYSAGAGGQTGTLSPAATWRRAMLGDWGDAIAGGSFNGDPIGDLRDLSFTLDGKTHTFKGAGDAAAKLLEESTRPASWGSW